MSPDGQASDRDRIATDGGDRRTVPGPDDEGKDVVDARGREVGLVEGVEGDTLYVDPHPSLTDSVRSKLGVGGPDADAFPVTPEFVDHIGEDVVLDVERDEEFQRES